MDYTFKTNRVVTYCRVMWECTQMTKLFFIYTIGYLTIFCLLLLIESFRLESIGVQNVVHSALFKCIYFVYIGAGVLNLHILNYMNKENNRIIQFLLPISFLEQFIFFILFGWATFFGLLLMYAVLSVNVIGNIYALCMGEYLFWQNPLSVFQYSSEAILNIGVPVVLFWQALLFMILSFLSRNRAITFGFIILSFVLLFYNRTDTYILFDYRVWQEQSLGVRLLYHLAPLIFYFMGTYGIRRQQL